MLWTAIDIYRPYSPYITDMANKRNAENATTATPSVSATEIANAQDDGLGRLEDLATRWDINNTEEFTQGTLVTKEGKLGIRREIEEQKDGVKTGRKLDIAYVYVLVGEKVKEAKLYNKMIQQFTKAWGADRKAWVGKHVRAKFSGQGKMQFLEWSPDTEGN